VADTAELVRRARVTAGADVRVLFDVYHVQRTEGELLGPLRACAADVGHVQVADVPGRGRPGSGTLDWVAFFETLEGLGYQGWVGLEHVPSADPSDTFAWLDPRAD
jgi:hydroxypyruvate isomerase